MPTLFTFTIADADDEKSSVGYYVDSSVIASLTDVDTIAERLWDVIRPMITGILVNVSVNFGVDISAYAQNTPSALSDVQEKVKFFTVHQGQNRGESSNHTISTVKEKIFFANGAGTFVNHTDSDVAVYQTTLESAYADGGVSLVNEHDEPILELAVGYQYWGKNRNLRRG